MDAPEDLEARVEAVQEQIRALYNLNMRFQTNYPNLSRAVAHGKQHRLLEKADLDRLTQINRRANEAKHHDLGCGAQKAQGEDHVFDSADLGIVAVLKSSSQSALRVREIFLLGLARDPEKDQMGSGVKKEVNRRLYALQTCGHVIKARPDSDEWKFAKDVPLNIGSRDDALQPPSESVLPADFGSGASSTLLGAMSQLSLERHSPPTHANTKILTDSNMVLRVVASASEPMAVDEVALLCLGIANPKQAKKDLSKLLGALRDQGAISENSGRWMSKQT